MNKCVSTSLPFVFQDDLVSSKPVLLKGSICVIAEVSCPYDLNANEVYDEKRRKYAALSEEIERNGFRCSVKPVIVRSTGSVHKVVLLHLMQMVCLRSKEKDCVSGFLTQTLWSHTVYGMLDVVAC